MLSSALSSGSTRLSECCTPSKNRASCTFFSHCCCLLAIASSLFSLSTACEGQALCGCNQILRCKDLNQRRWSSLVVVKEVRVTSTFPGCSRASTNCTSLFVATIPSPPPNPPPVHSLPPAQGQPPPLLGLLGIHTSRSLGLWSLKVLETKWCRSLTDPSVSAIRRQRVSSTIVEIVSQRTESDQPT